MTGATLIHTLYAEPILFGAKNLGAAGRRSYSGVDAGAMLVWLLLAAVVIAAVCGAIYLATRCANYWRYRSPAALFLGLCGVHGLGSGDRRLLKQLARAHKLSDPARLFIEPAYLAPNRLPGSLRARTAAVATLRNRLFGESGK